jgi:hypothetical protein
MAHNRKCTITLEQMFPKFTGYIILGPPASLWYTPFKSNKKMVELHNIHPMPEINISIVTKKKKTKQQTRP